MTSPTPATPPLYTPWAYTPSGKAEAWVREKVLQMQGRKGEEKKKDRRN